MAGLPACPAILPGTPLACDRSVHPGDPAHWFDGVWPGNTAAFRVEWWDLPTGYVSLGRVPAIGVTDSDDGEFRVPVWGDVHDLGEESWRGPDSPGDGWRRD